MDIHDRIISQVYEASISPKLWPQALETFADATRSAELTLSVFQRMEGADSGFAATRVLVSGRMWGEDVPAPYLDHYSKIDPLGPIAASLPEGELVLCHEHMSNADVSRSEYHQDLLIPLGGRYVAAWILEHSLNRMIMLGLHKRQEHFERDELEQWKPIAQHVRHAVSLSAKFHSELIRGQLLRQAVDHQGIICIMVDDNARVLDSSAAAAKLLEEGRYLKLRNRNQLITNAVIETKRLRDLITSSANGRVGGTMRLAGRLGERHSVVHVVPCGVQFENPFDPKLGNCALVFVSLPEPPHPVDCDKLRIALECTPAEAEVASDLACGLSPTEIAIKRTVSLNTVRTQIRMLLSRTDRHRIAELVSVLTAIR